MSIYEYSSDFQERLEQFVPTFLRPLVKATKPFIKNILPGIGFLSQDVSGSIGLTYDGSETKVKLISNAETPEAIRKAMRRISRTSRNLGLLRLLNPFETPNVGAGFHAGASLPMGDGSQNLVDWSGRLRIEPRVHIVDASSLMRIKAGSHTFMAMANAYRIALNSSGE
jgi:choline dehydrogenase-like flavoprotein